MGAIRAYRRAGILGGLLALAALPSTAAATPLDVVSTRAYLRADNALTRSAKAHLHRAEAGVGALTRQIGRECPHIAAGAPQSPEAELLYEEIVAAVTHTVYHVDSAVLGRFTSTVGGLRWSSPRVTRAVHAYTSRLHGLATLGLPNVCADAKAWAASGFTALPAATRLIAQQLKTSEEAGPMELSPGVLRPYERPEESRTIAETARLEADLQEAEATHSTGYLSKIEGLMELNP
jgi:hypothetical protein